MTPSNLAPQAIEDLRRHLRRSAREFGRAAAERLADALLGKCDEIAQGFDHGHRRLDIADDKPYRFLTVRPLIVVYNPATRWVLRILDGRRDFTSIFR